MVGPYGGRRSRPRKRRPCAWRARPPPREGATVCGAPVTVSRVEGGLPASIELHLDDMDSPTVALLAWQAGALRRLTAPGVGTSIDIPWSEGPSGFF